MRGRDREWREVGGVSDPGILDSVGMGDVSERVEVRRRIFQGRRNSCGEGGEPVSLRGS